MAKTATKRPAPARRSLKRTVVVTGLLLAVSGCGLPTGSAESTNPTPTAAASSESNAGATAPGAPSSNESTRSPAVDTTSSTPNSPSASNPASVSTGASTSAGPDAEPPGETFTNEAGTISLLIPEGWTVEQAEYDDSQAHVGYFGVPYERYEITDKDDDIVLNVVTGTNAMDSDGVPPTLVQTLDAEELARVRSFQDDVSVYFLAQHQAYDEDGLPHTEETQYLVVKVADLPDSVDPHSQESVQAAWIHGMSKDHAIAGNHFNVLIDLPMVEALTGEAGDSAMRAFLETTEYRELKQMMMSLEVHEDAIPSPPSTP